MQGFTILMTIALLQMLLSSSLWAKRGLGKSPRKSNKNHARFLLETVQNATRIKILESSSGPLRPGSIYTNITRFESIVGFRPKFYYEFIDTGLGTAEPLYPIYQKGKQKSWWQLFPAFFSKKKRHIDHYTKLETIENCKVYSLYALRHISEYPDYIFAEERREGYQMMVIRFEYYEKMRPDAVCGKHLSYMPKKGFKPLKIMEKFKNIISIAEVPQKYRDRMEVKISAIKHFYELRDKKNLPRFDKRKLKNNSLWYYPNGYSEDYGQNRVLPQPGAEALSQSKHLVVQIKKEMRSNWNLLHFIGESAFEKTLAMMDGHPVAGYDSASEPGADTLKFDDIKINYIFTAGTYQELIPLNARQIVSNPKNYSLIGMTIKPYELEDDINFPEPKIIPQVRFVFQLKDPNHPTRHFEQVYFHFNYDVVDRLASQDVRDGQHKSFLLDVADLSRARDQKDIEYNTLLENFIRKYTAPRVENIAFSSSLTGLWVFGALTTTNNVARELRPVRIIREGVDVGYYSSVYDYDLFEAAIKSATDPERKKRLQAIQDDQVVESYRSEKRMDVHAIKFHRMTCAQCHHMAGRDAVFVGANDNADPRITYPARIGEYVYREAQRQLEVGQTLFK